LEGKKKFPTKRRRGFIEGRATTTGSGGGFDQKSSGEKKDQGMGGVKVKNLYMRS